jgi:two-component system chemotaxis response regulator CheB
MINVLIAEDSTATRMFLQHILESDPDIRVIGAVVDGNAVFDFLRQSRPDVILMDVYMPGMDGLETTRRIMETQPLPIVICSATASELVFRSLEAGALACIEKPLGNATSDACATAQNLLQTVKTMSEVRVVRRWRKPAGAPAPAAASAPLPAAPKVTVVGIGSSTGGPPALQTILAGLPENFPAPILVVQHIAKGFLPGMVAWLRQTTGLAVHLGADGMLPLPGQVYFAPDNSHMGLEKTGRIRLSTATAENGVRPAVGFLFRSLADVAGPNAVGVLLTGMGKDGAPELKRMKDAGAFTIAQDRATSVVHGMPGAAIALGGATHVLPIHKIAGALLACVKPEIDNREVKR